MQCLRPPVVWHQITASKATDVYEYIPAFDERPAGMDTVRSKQSYIELLGLQAAKHSAITQVNL